MARSVPRYRLGSGDEDQDVGPRRRGTTRGDASRVQVVPRDSRLAARDTAPRDRHGRAGWVRETTDHFVPLAAGSERGLAGSQVVT